VNNNTLQISCNGQSYSATYTFDGTTFTTTCNPPVVPAFTETDVWRKTGAAGVILDAKLPNVPPAELQSSGTLGAMLGELIEN